MTSALPSPTRVVEDVCYMADTFCGAGGSTTGLLFAADDYGVTWYMTAVNHWKIAVASHTENHPAVNHLCMNVDRVTGKDLAPKGKLNIYWGSPSCGEHSYAKGGSDIDDQNRVSAWAIVNHVGTLNPEVVIIENVIPFRNWGPIDDGSKKMRPIKARRGETYRAWFAAMESVGQGYTGRQWILNGADYGEPQSRTRLFTVFTAPGIVMKQPKPTHGRPGTLAVEQGYLKPWVGARKIIDFDLETTCIFDRIDAGKPLSPNTMKRVVAGIKRFCSGVVQEAFLVVLRQNMGAQSLDQPTPTVATSRHLAIAQPKLTPFVGANRFDNIPRGIDDPIPTVMSNAGGGGLFLGEPRIEPFILGQHGGGVARSLDEPCSTIATDGYVRVFDPNIEPLIVDYAMRDGEGSGKATAPARPSSEPLPTVITRDRFGLLEPYVVEYHAGVDRDNSNRVKPVDEPLPTQTTENRFGLAQPFISDLRHGEGDIRNSSLDEPTSTIPCKNGLGLTQPFFTAHFPERIEQTPRVRSVDDPTWTVTPRGAGDLCQPEIQPFILNHGSAKGDETRARSLDEPTYAVLTEGSGYLAQPFIVPQQGSGVDDPANPLQTVTTTSRGIRLFQPTIKPGAKGAGRIVEIDGKLYRLNLYFRMLQPKELAGAQGFPSDYVFKGGKGDQTKQIGNAVQVGVARALGSAAFEALGYTRVTKADEVAA